MFVKITQTIDNEVAIINPSHVAVIAQEQGGEGSILMFAQGQKIVVKEPMDKLLDMINLPILTPVEE